MQDGLTEMVARIDERTAHMEGDITELKETCKGLSESVNGHSTKLAAMNEKLKNANNGLSRRQTAGIGGGAGFIAAAVVAVIEYFKR